MSDHIETENIQCLRFVYTEGEHKCPAGSLLSTIITLTESQKDDTVIQDKEIADYLTDKGLIESTGKNTYQKVANKQDDLIDLGNKVSEAIGSEIESLNVDPNVNLGYSLHMLPVPKNIN